MLKRLVVLVSAVLLFPAWAQSQSQSSPKAKPSQASVQTKARVAADLTARLQARAIAEAAAQQAAGQTAALAIAPASMQTLPAAIELPPQRSEAPAAPTLAAVQPLTHADAGFAAPAPEPLSTPDPVSQDLAIAQQIHQGLMPCDMGASVRVEADAAAPGYFHVQGKGFRYRMYPVRTSTGALRLEDKKAGAVWLQLANKSMLMDQKKGRRVADDCAHPEQVAYGQDIKTNPQPSLFDKTGMGRSND